MAVTGRQKEELQKVLRENISKKRKKVFARYEESISTEPTTEILEAESLFENYAAAKATADKADKKKAEKMEALTRYMKSNFGEFCFVGCGAKEAIEKQRARIIETRLTSIPGFTDELKKLSELEKSISLSILMSMSAPEFSNSMQKVIELSDNPITIQHYEHFQSWSVVSQ
ncbi:MAG: hypothetical protein NT121_03400 [Chloroflexi bacterium]|nr:hypothetical protein [Chloroflexota bacterium]